MKQRYNYSFSVKKEHQQSVLEWLEFLPNYSQRLVHLILEDLKKLKHERKG